MDGKQHENSIEQDKARDAYLQGQGYIVVRIPAREVMMTAMVDKIEREALRLPKEERAFLADRLLSSLDGEVLSDVEEAWVAEAERRYAEYQEGKRQPISATDVFAEADRMLG